VIRDLNIRKSFHGNGLARSGRALAPWQGTCASLSRANMKKEQAASLDLAQAPQLPWPWALLVAELAAAVLLFSAGRMPALLVRSLQLFLRF
jgi:hypothetical protein